MDFGKWVFFVVVLFMCIGLVIAVARKLDRKGECEKNNGVYLWREGVCVDKKAIIK